MPGGIRPACGWLFANRAMRSARRDMANTPPHARYRCAIRGRHHLSTSPCELLPFSKNSPKLDSDKTDSVATELKVFDLYLRFK